MFKVEVRQKGFDRMIQSLAQYPRIATEENRNAMSKAVNLVARVGKQNAPVGAVGELRAKITGEVREAGPGSVVGVVGSYARHGLPVEMGARPHWPNMQNLSLWVLRKLRVQRGELQQVTFLIGRAISRRGTRAQPYLEPAAEDSQQKISGFFQQALANIVRRLVG